MTPGRCNEPFRLFQLEGRHVDRVAGTVGAGPDKAGRTAGRRPAQEEEDEQQLHLVMFRRKRAGREDDFIPRDKVISPEKASLHKEHREPFL